MRGQTTSAAEFDVVVVGAGPAGTSAAITLATRGARVLLLEQKRFPRPKLCGEFISPECLTRFARLGVLTEMTHAGGARVTTTSFYTQGGRKITVPSAWFGAADTVAGAALGLSRAEMDERLLLRARAVGVEVWEAAQATGLICAGARVAGVQVQTNGQTHSVRAHVTLDATGRTRALARRVERVPPAAAHNGHGSGHGSAVAPTRPRLVAFKAHLAGVRGAVGACEIYFYRGGYGGLNEVEGGLSNLCFIVAAGDVRARASDAERVMREVVMANPRAAYALGPAQVRSAWLAVALESFGRHRLVPAAGLLTVGDAAAFIDPFTGSGMLLALDSGTLAADVVAAALPDLRTGAEFTPLAAAYRAAYRARFAGRLRVCSVLRRAAFAPQPVTEVAALALNASTGLRRALARATRKG